MTPRLVGLGCLLVAASSCATRPPRFETSDAPPQEPPKVVEVRALRAPVETRAEPKYRIETTANRFLLALENRAPEQIESLLAPGATVREETSGTGNAALPALLHLARAWSTARETEPDQPDTATQVFGPTRIIELQGQGTESWVMVEVDGPRAVQGLWKIRLDHRNEAPQIAEVVLPKAN